MPRVTATIVAPPEQRAPDRSWWAVWCTPSGQPCWTRPSLLALALVAGLAYGWSMAQQVVEVYYAAAVRSMSMSWHNFFFAAVDPDATISLDKLPGALWLQVASVKLFGLHVWALVLPQVLEGVATILVLFHAVRRLAGPGAALAAAAIATAMPATVALNRGNVSDTLLILLLVCAADATAGALATGRERYLLIAALWIGLAFQAKMLAAWLLLPALALAWLLAGTAPLARRAIAVATLCVVACAVSLVWMVAVALTPAHDRPYVDGSRHNSIFDQVFSYNGFNRVGGSAATPGSVPISEAAPLRGVTLDSASALDRTVAGPGGRDAGWLLPAALAAGALALVVCRGRPRTDPLRAAILLWGTWLLIDLVAFATSLTLNAYYLAALSPPIAALIGTSGAAWHDALSHSPGRVALIWFVPMGVGATICYHAYLLEPAGEAIRIAVPIVALVFAGFGVIALRAAKVRLACVWLLLAISIAPAAASAALVANGWGPFDTPFQPSATTDLTQTLPATALRITAGSIGRIEQARGSAHDLAATYSALLAAPFIYQSGQEVLPIGGFTGTMPSPTLEQLQQAIAGGDLHLVISPAVSDPRIAWIAAHCFAVAGVLPAYYCAPGVP